MTHDNEADGRAKLLLGNHYHESPVHCYLAYTVQLLLLSCHQADQRKASVALLLTSKAASVA